MNSFADATFVLGMPNASFFAADLFFEGFRTTFPAPPADAASEHWRQYVAFYQWSDASVSALANATRVTGASPIVGGWLAGNAAVANDSTVVVFLPNDVYFLAMDDDPASMPGGRDGIEVGTYAWNAATGSLVTSRLGPTYVDTNGEWGLSHTGPGTASVSADGRTLAFVDSTGAFPFARIGPGPAQPDNVIEYYHAAFDHYFITDLADEIAKLDAGVFVGWARSGRTFRNYPLNTVGAHNVCRFFSTSFAPKSSHFYTPFATECAIVQRNPDWLFEGAVFALALSNDDGECVAGTLPLYRLYNDGQGNAPNHRYTVSVVIRASMIAAGWVAEGRGADGVIGCVPV